MKEYLGFGSKLWDLIVTGGVSGGFVAAYSALFNPGDRVLIPDPFFPVYRDTATLFQLDVGFYDTYPSFVPTVEQIERAWTPETRGLVLCSPGNPTGQALTQEQLDQILDFAKKKDLWVIYDEIYSELSFDSPHAQCLWRYEKAVILNAFSKSLGVPGWRIGYVIAPNAVADQIGKVQQLVYVCAPTPLQHGVLAGVGMDLESIRSDFKRKRDFVFSALSDSYSIIKPAGSFFMFPEAPGGSGEQFFNRCLEQNLIIVPGGAFSRQDTHFRLSFSAPDEVLERGVEVLRRLVRG